MKIKCNDCHSEYDMTDAEWAEGKCLVCGGTNIIVTEEG